jgi:hypothetical protein
MALSLLLCCGIATPAHACATPVFRYALERWDPATYKLQIVHRGALTKDETAVVAAMQEFSADGKDGLANYTVEDIDLATDDRPESKELASHVPSLPGMILRYGVPRNYNAMPPDQVVAPIAWEGKLTPDNARAVMNSPARRKIVEQIAAGKSVVWIVLGGEDHAAADAAAQKLEKQLADLQASLALPEDPQRQQLGQPDLQLAFGLVRLERNDPQEAVLVSTLARFAPDQAANARDTLIVPVFGRGRVLGIVSGAQAGTPDIEDAARFMTGSCSCEVKDANPGFDLILSAPWSSIIAGERYSDPPVPALTGLAQFAAPLPSPAAATPLPGPSALAASSGPPGALGLLNRNLAFAVGGLVVTVAAASLWLLRKGRSAS